MASNRRLANYAIIVTILAVAGTFLSIAWMGATSVSIMHATDLSIIDVKFDKDGLTITVKNQGSHTLTINEVTVSEAVVSDEGTVNQTSSPRTFLVRAPVLDSEQISINMSFKWNSGYLYQIKLETANTADFSPAVLCFVRAP